MDADQINDILNSARTLLTQMDRVEYDENTVVGDKFIGRLADVRDLIEDLEDLQDMLLHDPAGE